MKINWEVYYGNGNIDVSLADLELTQEEWDTMSVNDQEDKLKCYMDEWLERNAFHNYSFKGWEK